MFELRAEDTSRIFILKNKFYAIKELLFDTFQIDFSQYFGGIDYTWFTNFILKAIKKYYLHIAK
jgi:hypothetical protein